MGDVDFPREFRNFRSVNCAANVSAFCVEIIKSTKTEGEADPVFDVARRSASFLLALHPNRVIPEYANSNGFSKNKIAEKNRVIFETRITRDGMQNNRRTLLRLPAGDVTPPPSLRLLFGRMGACRAKGS